MTPLAPPNPRLPYFDARDPVRRALDDMEASLAVRLSPRQGHTDPPQDCAACDAELERMLDRMDGRVR